MARVESLCRDVSLPEVSYVVRMLETAIDRWEQATRSICCQDRRSLLRRSKGSSAFSGNFHWTSSVTLIREYTSAFCAESDGFARLHDIRECSRQFKLTYRRSTGRRGLAAKPRSSSLQPVALRCYAPFYQMAIRPIDPDL